jgi:hypothetical protein
MDSRQLKEAQKAINDKIEAFAKEQGLSTNNLNPIYDGIADVDKYLSCGKKIMWLLKEPYDDFDDNGNPLGGGWSIVDDCFTGCGIDGKSAKTDVWSNRTWQPIIYSMYGYFNNLLWERMPWIRDDKDMATILQQIAFINISKMPNQKRSNDKQIVNFYEKWKPILFEQINTFNPDVVICGNTFKYLRQDLGIADTDFVNESHVDCVLDPYKKDCRLWLDINHPNQKKKGISRELYVNSIINALKIDDK